MDPVADMVSIQPAIPAQGLSQAGPTVDRQRIRQAAEDFEAVFLSQMLQPMFEGLETDGLFGGGSAEQIYRGVLLQEYGKALAQRGGVGIADAVEQEMLKLQEVE